MRSCEHHCLLLEVLYMRTLCEELRHIVHLVSRLAREHIASSGENSSTNEYRHIRKVFDKFLHEGQVLRSVILSRYMNLQEGNVDVCHRIVVTLCRVANEKFTLRIVVFQPILQGSTYEAASDNSNVNHCD